MNVAYTGYEQVEIEVVGYSDDVWNLRIRTDNRDRERIAVSEEQAQQICEILNVECPDPEPEPPKQCE
jgi:hypothetical protein